ncbi:hypothetical protein C2G38_2167175 [Gigaspora rosea]|uniref:Uncharacterized protein n=1 Tax=Gigaspora rosea TaxID=44941 RepID=A0A397VSN8_9GLOM|nr:hypothetical protein C2G38_2167175 [Gigaspora rosea]CAG8535730.1 7464_t:CDS:2 [Gigaspora rosea]
MVSQSSHNFHPETVQYGLGANAHNGVPPKRLGNVAIRPSRPAPITPPSILPILPTDSSSPPLDHSFPTREDLEIVSPENEDGSFFPKSDVKWYKSDDYEQPSFDY